MKSCYVCKELKPLSEFSKDAKKTDGLSHKCKSCKSEYEKDVYPKHRAKKKVNSAQRYTLKREHVLKVQDESGNRHKNNLKKYGLTVEDFNEMLVRQNGVCKICRKPQTPAKLYLCVDHCHLTGKVRGLLCNRCNAGIGMFQDNEETMLSAISYLKESK